MVHMRLNELGRLEEGKISKTGAIIHYVIEEVDEGEPILVEERIHKACCYCGWN